MARIVIPSLARLKEWVGKEVAVTDWLAVSQERIDAFADATEDHQWIHVDRGRAAKESPYGTTVAHGFLTLSLLSHLLRDAVEIQGARLGINYGLNRVRFTGPVPSGSRVRARFPAGGPRGDRLGRADLLERDRRARGRGEARVRRGVDYAAAPIGRALASQKL